MNDENWIRELTKITLEQQEEESQLDERWDRLSSGELSPEEETELLALAETSEEGRKAYEAFRPLGPEFQASVVRTIRKKRKKRTLWEFLADHWKALANLLPLPRSAQFAGLGTAAAVAVVLIHLGRIPPSPPPIPPPIPDYVKESLQGDQDSRGKGGPSTSLPVFSPGSQLSLILGPQQDVTGPVEAHAFLTDGEDVVPWKPEPPLDIAGSGVVRLRGTLGQEIQLPLGVQTIWIVISRPGKGPSARNLQAELKAKRTRDADWQAVCDEVTAAPPRHEQWRVACANLRVED
ncbi:MAG TPA: hypothetical protein VKK31_20485 [Thermoanaerobaculia bacterium]|nr:hypothetical protein [Thermoanaerobaculia bacterium]